MQTKLTLRLDDGLIEQAKSFAARSGKSLSQVVADYFRVLPSSGGEPQQPAAPITAALRGVLRDVHVEEAEYRRHLEEKHR